MSELDYGDLVAGIAGEHLVCADLLLQGYRAIMTDQNCPYDLVVEHSGKLIRIQVKSTRSARRESREGSVSAAYKWQPRRAGKKGSRLYARGDFDVMALVALDIRAIAYVPWLVRQHYQLAVPGSVGLGRWAKRKQRQFSDYPFSAAIGAV